MISHQYYFSSTIILFGFIFPVIYSNKTCDIPIIMAEMNGIDGQYIAVLKETVNENDAEDFKQSLESSGAKINFHYSGLEWVMDENHSANNFHGYAFQVDEKKRTATLRVAKRNCAVKYIEQDQVVKISDCNTQTSSGWCLAKIPRLNDQYIYPSNAGVGASVCVIDTGCDVSHSDIQGRVKKIFNAVSSEDDKDYYGHGTCVASLIAGYRSGTAKAADLYCAKSLDKTGNGDVSLLLKGIDWCSKQVKNIIINMSLNGGRSRAINDAIKKNYKNGILTVAAAGNDRIDACRTSPASAPRALTVAASDYQDKLANFSNYGSCVDLTAPGLNCRCANIKTNSTQDGARGTSVAAPLVSGIAAVIQAKHKLFGNKKSPEIITKAILDAAKCDLKGSLKNTPNKILYWKCD